MTSAIGLAPQSPGLHDISQRLDGGITVDILATTWSLAFFSFFLDQHFPFPVTPSLSPGHHVTSPSGISFSGHSSICTAPPRVTLSDKSSHRHTNHHGLVGLAWAWGEIC